MVLNVNPLSDNNDYIFKTFYHHYVIIPIKSDSCISPVSKKKRILQMILNNFLSRSLEAVDFGNINVAWPVKPYYVRYILLATISASSCSVNPLPADVKSYFFHATATHNFKWVKMTHICLV